MSTANLFDQLKQMSDEERLELIETATRLVRQNLRCYGSDRDQELRIREAAARVQDLYEPAGELTEWTALDSEEIADDYFQG